MSVFAPGAPARIWAAASESRVLPQLLSALLFAAIGVELAVLVTLMPDTLEAWWSVPSTGDFGNFLNHARELEPNGLYSPALTLLLYPLTYLDPANAYRAFFALNVVALFGAAYLAQRGIGSVEGRMAMALGIIAIPQMHWALRLGHFTPLLALAALGGFLLLRRRPYLAGLCFAVLVLKPQYVPIPLLYLLWTRNGRALAGLLTGALVMEVAGFATVGFGTIGPYLGSFFDWGADARDNLLPYQQSWQYAWQGFLVSAKLDPNPLIILDLTVLSLGAAVLVWWRNKGATALAAAALAMVLVTPYANFYDWGLLAVGMVLLLKADIRWKPLLPVIVGGLYLGLLVSQAATPFPAVDVELGALGAGGEFFLSPAGAVFPTRGIYWITPAALGVICLLGLMARAKMTGEPAQEETAGARLAPSGIPRPQEALRSLRGRAWALPSRVALVGGVLAAGYLGAALIMNAPPFVESYDPFARKAVLGHIPDDFPLPEDSRLEEAGPGSELPFVAEWKTDEPVSEVAGAYRELLAEDAWELMLEEQTSPNYAIRLARYTPYGFMTFWGMLDVSPSGDGSDISLEFFITQQMSVTSAAWTADSD